MNNVAIPPAPHADDARLNGRLKDLMAAVDGVVGVVLASVDGFPLAFAGRAEGSEKRLAAMSSSMLGLATALSRELGAGHLDALSVEADDGKVLMLMVPGQTPRVLMVTCNRLCVMGQVLWHARQCVSAIAASAARA